MKDITNIEIRVEQRHIDKGTRKTCSMCPIALALDEQLRPISQPLVGLVVVTIGCKEYNLPQEATNFIMDFDAEQPVRPFTFKLLPYDAEGQNE